MIEDAYVKGNVPRVRKTFDDVTRNLFDPGTITFTIEVPPGVRTDYVYGTDPQVVRESLGIYYVDIPTDIEGVYWWRWDSDFPDLAEEGSFLVYSHF